MNPNTQFHKYITETLAYVNNVRTDCGKEPDERFMRGIEEKADIPEQVADDFRRIFICWYASFRKRHMSDPDYQDHPDLIFRTAILEYASG